MSNLPPGGVVGQGFSGTPVGVGIGSCASAAGAANAAPTTPIAIATASFIGSTLSFLSSFDGESSEHPGLGVALDRADVDVLPGLRELHGQRAALAGLEQRAAAELLPKREVVRKPAVVDDLEDHGAPRHHRLAELEAHLEHRDGAGTRHGLGSWPLDRAANLALRILRGMHVDVGLASSQ